MADHGDQVERVTAELIRHHFVKGESRCLCGHTYRLGESTGTAPRPS